MELEYLIRRDKRKREFIAFRADKTFLQKLKQQCELQGIDMSNLIRNILEQEFGKEELDE